MRLFVALSSLLIVFAGCSKPAPAGVRPTLADADAMGYRLVWQDEFDGAQLDEERWEIRREDRDDSRQSRDNVSLADGFLNIALKNERAGERNYTAGGIVSKREFLYGYYEVRARMPASVGWQSSFLLYQVLKKETGAGQVLKVMEAYSGTPDRFAAEVYLHEPRVSVGGKWQSGPNLSEGFHIWGCEFTPGEARFFFDGALILTRPVAEFSHDRMNIYLATVARANVDGHLIDDASLPTRSQFDYVRFFERPNTQKEPLVVSTAYTPPAPPATPTPKASPKPAASPAPATTAAPIETHPRDGLPNLSAKLEANREVKVAFFGASLTEPPGWRVLCIKRLQERYPKAKIVELSASRPGMNSEGSVYRLKSEVLAQKPDLIFVEFFIGDRGGPAPITKRAMEGIVRQTWRADPTIDLCFVYTFMDDDLKTVNAGKLPGTMGLMEEVAERYRIPSVNFAVEAARLYRDGKLLFNTKAPANDTERAALGEKIVYSFDNVHPNDKTGYPVLAASIDRAWPQLTGKKSAAPHVLGAPLDGLNYEGARAIPVGEMAREGAWQKLPESAPSVKGGGHPTPVVWSASQAGASIQFKFKGRKFGLTGVKGPDSGLFRVSVDGQPTLEDTLFDNQCTEKAWRYRSWFYPKELSDGEHRVKIEALGRGPDKVRIMNEHHTPIGDAPVFKENLVNLCDVLVLGELVK